MKSPLVRVFVGGGQEYYGPTAERDENITKKAAEILYRYVPTVQIVTGGMPGIADIFATEWVKLGGDCLDVVSQKYHQEYTERETGRSVMIAGNDQKHRRLRVTSLENIRCALFIQGGQYSTHEIKLFQEKDIPVVTLYGGGGASGGQCPYEGWVYEAPPHVLRSIVASTNPNEHVFNMANVLAGSVIHEISEALQKGNPN